MNRKEPRWNRLTGRLAFWTCLLVVALPRLQAEEEDLNERVNKLVRSLDADDFQEREKATAELTRLPGAAVAILEKIMASSTTSPEVRGRIQKKIKTLRYTAQRDARADWYNKVTLEPFLTKGHRDPKWDAAALQGIKLLILEWTKNPSRERDEAERAFLLFQQALQQGCEDPLVTYMYGWSGNATGRLPAHRLKELFVLAAERLKKHPYPPVREAYMYGRAALWTAQSDGRLRGKPLQQVKHWLALVLKALAAHAKEKYVDTQSILEITNFFMDAHRFINKNRKVAFDQIDQVLKAALPNHPAPLIVEGRFLISYAWDARGGGWASSVTKNGWKLMRERLAKSAEVLTKAHEMNPGLEFAAVQMLAVELGQGQGDERSEKWFNRALEANPNCYDACAKRLYYLEPKWHGSQEKLLAFARQCYDRKNWEGGLPFILLSAHNKLSYYGSNGYGKDASYFKSDAVWEDLQSIFEGHLKRFPKDRYNLGRYAWHAVMAEKWEKAHELFEKLGDRPALSAFGNLMKFDALRRRAAQRAGKALKEKNPATPDRIAELPWTASFKAPEEILAWTLVNASRGYGQWMISEGALSQSGNCSIAKNTRMSTTLISPVSFKPPCAIRFSARPIDNDTFGLLFGAKKGGGTYAFAINQDYTPFLEISRIESGKVVARAKVSAPRKKKPKKGKPEETGKAVSEKPNEPAFKEAYTPGQSIKVEVLWLTDRVEATFDGQVVLAVNPKDPEKLARPGQIGFFCHGMQGVEFRDLKVEPFEASAAKDKNAVPLIPMR